MIDDINYIMEAPLDGTLSIIRAGKNVMETLEDTFFEQLAYACSEARQAYGQYIGMSQARLQLLTSLAQQSEISHAALQQRLAVDGATVTRLVKQFEAEGIVSRRLDPQDNRYTLVTLTPAGRQIVAGLKETHTAFQLILLEGIPREELEVTLRTLQRLRANIRDAQAKEKA
jgi:DNA-binding MarR family transcriptional regulator